MFAGYGAKKVKEKRKPDKTPSTSPKRLKTSPKHETTVSVKPMPFCNCRSNGSAGFPAKLCTTKKPGPNQGRKFFACPNSRAKQCKFFLWEDEYNQKNGEASNFPKGITWNKGNHGLDPHPKHTYRAHNAVLFNSNVNQFCFGKRMLVSAALNAFGDKAVVPLSSVEIDSARSAGINEPLAIVKTHNLEKEILEKKMNDPELQNKNFILCTRPEKNSALDNDVVEFKGLHHTLLQVSFNDSRTLFNFLALDKRVEFEHV